MKYPLKYKFNSPVKTTPKSNNMKTGILLLFFILSGLVAMAQPNFTSADMPNIGDHDTLMVLQYQAITNNLDTETGNGYTWDFSSLPFSVLNLIDVDSFRVKQHYVSAAYTGATIEEFKNGVTSQTVNLYSYRNDTLFIHRMGGPSTGWALGPMASIAFPIAFNSSSVVKSNIYTGTGFTILVGERTTTTKYDGFGTLKMPNGKTYTDVFRIKETERDTNYVTMAVTVATNYIWYKQGGQVPLLRLAYSGVLNLYFVFGSRSNSTVSGIENRNSVPRFKIFPNPASDIIHINASSNYRVSDYIISDQLGRTVLRGKISPETMSIDISGLTTGMYFINFNGMTSETCKIFRK
jgi:hypothetical protein